MKSKQQVIFATKYDIINVMSKLDATYQLEYIPLGTFDDKAVMKYDVKNLFKQVGYTNYSNWISLDNRYMIIRKGDHVQNREIILKDGHIKYVTDLANNPLGVELSTGGIYSREDKILIAGRVAVFESSEQALSIYKAVLKEIRKSYSKINYAYVSPEALLLQKQGWRLTFNANSSREADFII